MIHLIGGGWDADCAPALYGQFVLEAEAVAGRSGRPGKPILACVVFDEGDGREQFARWDSVLTTVGFCEPVPVLVDAGAPLDVGMLGNADGLLVCGGLTPGYAAAVAPAAVEVLDWLTLGDRPYAGFSAGSAVASADAVVGGWLAGTVPVCPEDAAEDLDQVAVVGGLGVVPFFVDVHCAQWGTLPRLATAVRSTPGSAGVGIDENTVLIVDSATATATVRGRGQGWLLREQDGSVIVSPFRDGEHLTVPF